MKTDLSKAIDILKQGQYTCVLCKGEEVYTASERGVKPLINLLDSGIHLNGFSAADKIVGNAAAFLYVLLGVKEVYADVMSESAIHTLTKYDIKVQFDVSTGNIINRAGTGNCPMEEAVKEATDPQTALQAIRVKLAGMQQG